MVRQRGYPGSVVQVRRLVRRLRPESGRAVYRRVVTLPGEQAQVDWGAFGKVRIGQGARTVSGADAGSIPASAGNPPTRPTSRQEHRGHPRERGESPHKVAPLGKPG